MILDGSHQDFAPRNIANKNVKNVHTWARSPSCLHCCCKWLLNRQLAAAKNVPTLTSQSPFNFLLHRVQNEVGMTQQRWNCLLYSSWAFPAHQVLPGYQRGWELLSGGYSWSMNRDNLLDNQSIYMSRTTTSVKKQSLYLYENTGILFFSGVCLVDEMQSHCSVMVIKYNY